MGYAEEVKVCKGVSNPSGEFELLRGKIAEFNEGMLLRAQFLLSEKKYSEAEDFMKPVKLSSNFSGTLFSVSFNCDRSIALTKLGFWGPAKADFTENYEVTVMIWVGANPYNVGRSDSTGTMVRSIRSNIRAEGREIFCVGLEDAIRIEAGAWCRIKFQLDGPNTCICGSVEPTYKCKDSDAVFEFAAGSNQLAKLFYTL